MIGTSKYEDAKKMVEDAGLIGKNDGHPDIHYQEIAHLLVEVKRLREGIAALVDKMTTTVHLYRVVDAKVKSYASSLKELIE